jgi:hypothetical protein
MNTKFCFKVGKTPTEKFELLQIVCGDEVFSSSSRFERFKRFRDGREDLQDDPRSGGTSTCRNADTFANIREIVIPDRRLTLRRFSWVT